MESGRGRGRGVFVDMDRMVGGMFDQGLNQMKTVVERRP